MTTSEPTRGLLGCVLRPSKYGQFQNLWRDLVNELDVFGEDTNVGEWQARQGTPLDDTRELLHVNFMYKMPPGSVLLAQEVEPNLPWAENHFKERVGGEPLNPGKEYRNWPWFKGNVEEHQTQEEEKFSHTYMERMWPRDANPANEFGKQYGTRHGIRFEYGDLNNLIHMLSVRPDTRQAYLPIWFPEDLHAADVENERVPCTLGYRFIRRGGRLDITYDIRSCDLFRHFRDDVYLACRLCQWVLDKLQNGPPSTGIGVRRQWEAISPGYLVMNITSLHVFKGDLPRLKKEAARAANQ